MSHIFGSGSCFPFAHSCIALILRYGCVWWSNLLLSWDSRRTASHFGHGTMTFVGQTWRYFIAVPASLWQSIHACGQITVRPFYGSILTFETVLWIAYVLLVIDPKEVTH